MDNVAHRGVEVSALAVKKILEDLAIHDLRVDIVGECLHLRGLVTCYEKKCLAGARALRAFPGTYVSNGLRVCQV